MQIKNVVFDFGGVLMDWSPFYFFDEYYGSHEKAQWLIDNICTSEWNATMDCGVSFADAAQKLQQIHPQYHADIQAYIDNWHSMLRGAIDPTVELLMKIHHSHKFKLYGLTNWSAETFPWTREHYPFFKVFDGILVSGEDKLIKPDPAIFKLLLERYELSASDCLFIDDNARNIAVAKELGFNTEHFTDLTTSIANIEKLLDL